MMGMLSIWMYIIAIIIVILQALLYYIRLKQDRKYTEDIACEHRKTGYISQLTKEVKYKKDIIHIAPSKICWFYSIFIFKNLVFFCIIAQNKKKRKSFV